MKALSIKQPWAYLIVNGIKDVENRTRPTSFRGRIYVHAGAKPDRREAFIYPVALTSKQIEDLYDIGVEWTEGAIVGEVDIVACDYRWPGETGLSDWHEEGLYGYMLANPVAYAEPIPCKGQLGFFDVDINKD